ncbi:MAG: glutamine synthetase III [Clostridia bacterium]|nr:glutamine synthetase III [Clostridia bacterium]
MKVSDIFASMVFSDAVMRERLPKETYNAIQRTIRDGRSLDINAANVIANTMKDWAIEKGATHYTHWFQPMTGFTAEKHDSFVSFSGDGRMIMEFSGKELVQGETDASSFPAGGLRSTFEARGYTAWDATSYAFIKDGVLCIPTAFCSYGGEALDKKTPLLRSMEALNRQTKRVLELFGNKVSMVRPTVGPEQEYFLIDEEMYRRRRDLVYTGRTLFGAKPPKGQDLDDHYFGSIKPRVKEFMNELDVELWKLGIYAKTEHNEAAPAQHELAPVFDTTNIAVDHNQITMELMQKIAKRHGMVCLLHEKPFAGVNGSGKHNNWSLTTDTGVNLLEPGDTPSDNAQFLLFLTAVIKAVDDYQDMLRISVASAGNDHRLGAAEAPPAIVSMFLGDELTAILDSIVEGTAYDAREKELMRIGVHTLPKFPKDNTDRNRTSPFAFTGNKFEFRMLGSAASVSAANVVLNTAVAESLRLFADELEGAADLEDALHTLIRREISGHKRIIFNGNGYSEEWEAEAERRGLLNLRTTPDALPYYLLEKNIRLFGTHRVLDETEIRSRYDILMENYSKIIGIEALTMIDMVRRDILPAVSKYAAQLSENAMAKLNFMGDIPCDFERETAGLISTLTAELYGLLSELEDVSAIAKNITDVTEQAVFYKDRVLTVMADIRSAADELEELTAAEMWPYPTYGEMLASIG